MVFVTPETVDPLSPEAGQKAAPALPKMPLENGAPANFDETLHKKGGK